MLGWSSAPASLPCPAASVLGDDCADQRFGAGSRPTHRRVSARCTRRHCGPATTGSATSAPTASGHPDASATAADSSYRNTTAGACRRATCAAATSSGPGSRTNAERGSRSTPSAGGAGSWRLLRRTGCGATGADSLRHATRGRAASPARASRATATEFLTDAVSTHAAATDARGYR